MKISDYLNRDGEYEDRFRSDEMTEMADELVWNFNGRKRKGEPDEFWIDEYTDVDEGWEGEDYEE